MEHTGDWFTFTAEEACTYSARKILELMGDITGEYDARHYFIRAVESDRVTLYYSESTERDNHFARLDDWMEGADESKEHQFEHSLLCPDNYALMLEMIDIALRDEDAWDTSPEHAGKSPIEDDDEDFSEWLGSIPHFFDKEAAYEYVKKHVVIRPPEGSEEHGQIVAYPGCGEANT